MRVSLSGDIPANKASWQGCSQQQNGEHYRGILGSSHFPEIARHSWYLSAFFRVGPISCRNLDKSTRWTSGGHVMPIVELELVVPGESEKQ